MKGGKKQISVIASLLGLILIGLIVTFVLRKRQENFVTTGYTTLWYKKLNGNDITKMTNTNLEACKIACNEKEGCQGIVAPSNDPKVCTLMKGVPKFSNKTSPENYNINQGFHSYIKN